MLVSVYFESEMVDIFMDRIPSIGEVMYLCIEGENDDFIQYEAEVKNVVTNALISVNGECDYNYEVHLA